MNNIRKELIGSILESCLKSKFIINDLLYLAIIGSTRTGEEIESYSDLDILFIFKSSDTGEIRKDIILELKKVSEKLSGQYSIEISFLAHTIFDFEQYVDFNYLIHYSWGDVIYGDAYEFKKIFKNIIDKKYSDKIRKDLIYYNLIHARFNLIRKYISWNKFNKVNYKRDILKLIIDLVIEMCDWALVYRNIFEERKINILKQFNNNFKLKMYNHIPEQAYKIRSNWANYLFEEDELNKFIDDSILFTQELVDLIHKEHVKN